MFKDRQDNGAYTIFKEEKDSFTLKITMPIFNPKQFPSGDKYVSDIYISLSDQYRKLRKDILIKNISHTITYNKGKNKVNKLTYRIITYRMSDMGKRYEFNSFKEIPERLRKTSSHLSIYFIYHNLPIKTDKIQYNIEIELIKDGKEIKINKFYELNRKSMKFPI